MIQPVTQYIMEVLPEGARDTKPSELAYEDLEKMPPEDIMRTCEWLTDKVSASILLVAILWWRTTMFWCSVQLLQLLELHCLRCCHALSHQYMRATYL